MIDKEYGADRAALFGSRINDTDFLEQIKKIRSLFMKQKDKTILIKMMDHCL